MTVVIGTDEAGYGPNLGPLVIGATAWRIDAAEAEAAEAIAAAARDAGGPWVDSKIVYRGGSGLARLEEAVLASLSVVRDAAAAPVPRAAAVEAVARLAGRCRDALAGRRVTLEAVDSRVIEPTEFNRGLDAGLTKADLLSRATLDLAAGLRARWPGERTIVWCDRHGGRRHYAGLLAECFDVPLVVPEVEVAARSCYELPAARCRVEFHVGGEARPPVALASMTAKYLRELAMIAFNEEWSRRVPGLAPTAGYPVDAARWRREAAAAVDRAGLRWDDLWRRA
jgi:ribonuclease HII